MRGLDRSIHTPSSSTLFFRNGARLSYVPAIIKLEGAWDARLISTVVDIKLVNLRVGLAVQLVWDDVADQSFAVPRFTPAVPKGGPLPTDLAPQPHH